MALDTYNNLYPSQYYEIGTCYAFYKSTASANRRAATDAEIAKFGSKLDQCYQQNSKIITGGTSMYNREVARSIGCVMACNALPNCRDGRAALDVLFVNEDGEFFVTKYIADGIIPAALNDKETVVPGTIVPGSGTAAAITATAAATKKAPAAPSPKKNAGPTEVKQAGPKEVKPAGPTEVKVAGPTEVK